MKRMLVVILVLTMVMVTTMAVAEDGSLIQWSDPQYVEQTEGPEVKAYVLLPMISLRKNPDGNARVKSLKLGDPVTIETVYDEWTKITSADGVTGYTKTGYVGYAYKILLGKETTYIFRQKGGTIKQLGSIAADRTNEVVLVLSEDDEDFFVVTLDGRSGYMSKSSDYTYYYEE